MSAACRIGLGFHPDGRESSYFANQQNCRRSAFMQLLRGGGDERGWMYRDELCSALRVDLPQLNLLVFRARKALDGTSSTLGAGLIERRLRTGQLRIGVSRLRVDQAS
jgi:hypothetical protein